MIALLLVVARAGALHPPFPVLDATGADVLASGAPYSPMTTCGACHDTAYIAEHSAHARVATGWDPDLYAEVDPADEPERWARTYGLDHAGGGLITSLGVELDCVLCHLDAAADEARREALAAGRFAVVNTATLSGTGLVTIGGEISQVAWNREAFDDGSWPIDRLPLRDPTSERCGSCHGTVYRGREPLDHPSGQRSRTTGQVYSGQRIDASALNLVDKEAASRSWDVHAERLLECANCHYSVNNPVYRQEWTDSRPEHLLFDARKMALGSYLQRPSHELAKGSSTAAARPELKGSMRRCEGCHDPIVGHDWLPDRTRHFGALACESCHVPKVYGPAREMLDWTALDAQGEPLAVWRGAEGPPADARTLQAGYTPILLPRREADGRTRLAPFNVSSVFHWSSGGHPVDRAVLQAVWSDTEALVATFDADGDGTLSAAERRLDTDAKTVRIREILVARGVEAPEIVGSLEPHALHHGVTRGAFVTRECTACHAGESIVYGTLEVARWLPGDVLPTLQHADRVPVEPDHLERTDDGRLELRPRAVAASQYVFGADRVLLVDLLGVLGLLGALAFAFGHGGLRWLTSRNRSTP